MAGHAKIKAGIWAKIRYPTKFVFNDKLVRKDLVNFVARELVKTLKKRLKAEQTFDKRTIKGGGRKDPRAMRETGWMVKRVKKFTPKKRVKIGGKWKTKSSTVVAVGFDGYHGGAGGRPLPLIVYSLAAHKPMKDILGLMSDEAKQFAFEAAATRIKQQIKHGQMKLTPKGRKTFKVGKPK